MNTNKKSWKWMAPLGLVLIGAGFSIAAEATLMKGAGKPLWDWVIMGTLGLTLLNSGIAVFGEAVKRSI